MSISLTKGGNISLSKQAPGLSAVVVGLGWDARTTSGAGFDLDAWAGIVAPARTPPEIVTRLSGELRKIIDSPDTKTKLKTVGFEAFSSTPDEFGRYIKAQLDNWGKMVADAKIERR